MLSIYKTKSFERQYLKKGIDSRDLDETIKELLYSSNKGGLGHKLFKSRIESPFKGKRGSYRAIVYCKVGKMIIFLHLYAKNEKTTLSPKEMKGFILLSKDLDRLTDQDIGKLVIINELVRYTYEEKRS
jgi:hypothetical protein